MCLHPSPKRGLVYITCHRVSLLLLVQDDSGSDRLREHVLYLCSDSVINLLWCWKGCSEQDLVYLWVPDGYGCRRTPGRRRASPRQQGRPPAKAKMTSPTVSSWEGEGGEKKAKDGEQERTHEKRLEPHSKQKILQCERWLDKGQRKKNDTLESRIHRRKIFFQHGDTANATAVQLCYQHPLMRVSMSLGLALPIFFWQESITKETSRAMTGHTETWPSEIITRRSGLQLIIIPISDHSVDYSFD